MRILLLIALALVLLLPGMPVSAQSSHHGRTKYYSAEHHARLARHHRLIPAQRHARMVRYMREHQARQHRHRAYLRHHR